MSAGAVLMSKDIKIASIADENDINIKDLKALELNEFEFLPHFNIYEKDIDKIIQYSLTVNHPIYACNDGDGIVIRDNNITFAGNVTTIYRGKIEGIKQAFIL